MKTSEQISEYLRTRPYYDTFVENLKNGPEASAKEVYLAGEAGESTFTDAFCWAETPQSYMFWHEVNNIFMTWLNDKK